ncbi:MAG: glycosyltransferase family 2 protein [Desulfovibrionales bacterium]
MKISFVIPTYNYKEFLRNCLISVFKQDYNDYEVIVVDDGSTDGTSELMSRIQAEYPTKAIKYLYQENTGPSAARNNGVAYAKGEYVWCLDADDTLNDGAVDKMVRAAEEYPEAWLLFSGYQSIDEKGKKVMREPSRMNKDQTKNFRRYILKKISGLCVGTAIVKRQVFNSISFPVDIAINEDIVFYSKVLAHYQAASVPGIVLTVNRHKGSQRSNVAKMCEAGLKPVENIFDKDLLTAKQLNYRKLYLARWYLTLFRAHYRRKEFEKARWYYKKAISERPAAVFSMAYLSKYLRSYVKS